MAVQVKRRAIERESVLLFLIINRFGYGYNTHCICISLITMCVMCIQAKCLAWQVATGKTGAQTNIVAAVVIIFLLLLFCNARK